MVFDRGTGSRNRNDRNGDLQVRRITTPEQVAKIKQWLLLAVTTAEKELGGGTGQLKLRYVYDMFVQRYPVAAQIVSFDTFSLWVDEALENMKRMLKDNREAAEYVKGGTE